jgi:DNA polymerase V
MAHGGARKGAGRPKGQGRYGESTKAVRVPISLVDAVKEYAATEGLKLPLYSSRVQAGFPSPADDYIEDKIDLNHHLIKKPSATFLVRASGDSMIDAGIRDGDLLIVDRSLKPTSGKIVIAAVEGQLTVKRLIIKNGKPWLMPANKDFQPIPVDPESGVMVWGVVTNCIHAC